MCVNVCLRHNRIDWVHSMNKEKQVLFLYILTTATATACLPQPSISLFTGKRKEFTISIKWVRKKCMRGLWCDIKTPKNVKRLSHGE
jgi:hypothetical protein